MGDDQLPFGCMDDDRNLVHIGGQPPAAARTQPAGCEACGGPHSRWWSTPDGRAQLCPTCATLHGFGCP